MKCPYCLTAITENSKFCENCGEAVGQTKKPCQNCGSETSPDAKFCGKCGLRFPVQTYRSEVGEENFKLHGQIESAISPFKEQGERLSISGYLKESKEMYESGLKLLETRFGTVTKPSVANARANLLMGIARIHQQLGEQEQALAVLERSLEQVRDLEDLPSRILAGEIQQLIGWNHYRTGKTNRAAMSYYNGLGALGDTVENKQGAMLYMGLGMLFRSLGLNEDAKSYLERCRQIRLKLADNRGTAIASINLGVLYTQIGDYITAENYFRDALELHMRIQGIEGMAISNANLGYVRYEQEKYEEAVEYLETAIQQAREGSPWIIPICHGYLARIALARKDPESALEYAGKAEAAMGKARDLPNQAKLEELRALAAFLSKRYDEAFKRFENARSLFEQANLEFDRFVFLLNYGKSLIELQGTAIGGQPDQKDLKPAVDLIGQAMEGFNKVGNEKYAKACLSLLVTMNRDMPQ